LIGVTDFFRDTEAFAALQKSVVPELFAGRAAESVVRIWTPACASGEEAYSIAILMQEHMATLSAPPRVQIFATDIARPALGIARSGHYPAAQIRDSVSPERIERFFIKGPDTYTSPPLLREMCVFSDNSLLRDPPFSPDRSDLLPQSCSSISRRMRSISCYRCCITLCVQTVFCFLAFGEHEPTQRPGFITLDPKTTHFPP